MKKKNKNKIKALSLFANVGIAETYLKEVGIDVVLANEIDSQRVKFYNHLYPETYVINGDITEESISKEIIKKAKEFEVDLIMATPPCQGMSTAGKKLKDDERNYLIKYAVDIIENVKPKFVFLENVPEQLQTYISYNDKKILIPEYLKERLGKDYKFNESNIVNDTDKLFMLEFQLSKLSLFEVRYSRVGSNKYPDFATSGCHFIQNKKDFDYCGQCQDKLLQSYPEAKAFYEKWDAKHLSTLTSEEYDDLMKDIQVLKDKYNYIEKLGEDTKWDFSFYTEVELSKQPIK